MNSSTNDNISNCIYIVYAHIFYVSVYFFSSPLLFSSNFCFANLVRVDNFMEFTFIKSFSKI